jgi:hypothetical protein
MSDYRRECTVCMGHILISTHECFKKNNNGATFVLLGWWKK